jgi:hypothetical protein
MSEGGPSSKILRHQVRDAVSLTSLTPAAPGLVHPLDARLAQAEAEIAGLKQDIQQKELTRQVNTAHIHRLSAQLQEIGIPPIGPPPIQPDDTAVGLELIKQYTLGLPKGWLIGALKNGNKLVNIGGFISGHVLAVSEDRLEDAIDVGEYTSRAEDLEDWLKCKLAFHSRVEALAQGECIHAPLYTRPSGWWRWGDDSYDDDLAEIDVKAIVEVLEGSTDEVLARALENRTCAEGRALAAAYAKKRRGEKGIGISRVPHPPLDAPPPCEPGGSACTPSSSSSAVQGGSSVCEPQCQSESYTRGFQYYTAPLDTSPSSSGDTSAPDNELEIRLARHTGGPHYPRNPCCETCAAGAFARQSKEDREERDE